jgi:alkylated DNA repair dioxygenase AlkB
MIELLPYDGIAELYDNWIEHDLACKLFEKLNQVIVWQKEEIILFGRKIECPRLTAFYGDEDIYYRYSGKTHRTHAWPQELFDIKEQLWKKFGFQFNSVLCNYYKNNKDYMGWHSDDEPELDHNPTIASLTLGATRSFQFKHKIRRTLIDTKLTHGSLLIMRGKTQHTWQHRLPATKDLCGPRINLTFRIIKVK